MVTGDGRIKRDHTESVELVDPVVDAGVRGVAVDELRAERAAVVVVPHHPEHACRQRCREGFDHAAQLRVGRGLAEVGEVTGEDHRVGADTGGGDDAERPLQSVGGVDRVEQTGAFGAQVRVADVQENAFGRRMLCGAHGPNVTGMFRRPGRRTGRKG